MKIIAELLPQTYLLDLQRFDDTRGSFVKTVHEPTLSSLGLTVPLAEEFYSVSKKDVIRGLHFQTPPHAHSKFVYCAVGAVMDVLVDLRRGTGFGAVASQLLSSERPMAIWMPPGIAHGFRAVEDGSLMVYKTSAAHAPQNDAGIRFDSIGYEWGCATPIVSNRDLAFPSLVEFESPF